MLEDLKEYLEVLKTDAKIFEQRGEKVAEEFTKNLIQDLENILEK